MSHTVVGDTSPFLYLHCIGQINLLPALFGQVHIPETVSMELCHRGAPAELRNWSLNPPSWLLIHDDPADGDPAALRLDAGESAAIFHAKSLGASLILIDERKGARICLQKGFEVTGTLGILAIAARRGLDVEAQEVVPIQA